MMYPFMTLDDNTKIARFSDGGRRKNTMCPRSAQVGEDEKGRQRS